MSDIPPKLSGAQQEMIEKFLSLFAEIEKALKVRLRRRINDPSGVRAMIDDYAEKNPFWTDSANQLRNLADIRNLLTHQRDTEHGYPIAIAPSSMQAIRRIKVQLLEPESVAVRFRRSVKTVSSDGLLLEVLAMAFENGFSQFPVVNEGRFGGLITENEIVRWLGHRAQARSVEVNLGTVTVGMVLKEKDPHLKSIQIFHFERLDAPVTEVMGRFLTHPALEVVILTRSGGKDTPIEGIVTQWDAARF